VSPAVGVAVDVESLDLKPVRNGRGQGVGVL